MNSTSPSSRLVSRPARSLAFSIVGPLVALTFAPIALARMLAMVVLPKPGGPLSKIWSSASPRCLAAATAISSRSFTFGWPVKSEKSDGRSVISSATSGLFKVATGRSDIATACGKRARSGKRDCSGGGKTACGSSFFKRNCWKFKYPLGRLRFPYGRKANGFHVRNFVGDLPPRLLLPATRTSNCPRSTR